MKKIILTFLLSIFSFSLHATWKDINCFKSEIEILSDSFTQPHTCSKYKDSGYTVYENIYYPDELTEVVISFARLGNQYAGWAGDYAYKHMSSEEIQKWLPNYAELVVLVEDKNIYNSQKFKFYYTHFKTTAGYGVSVGATRGQYLVKGYLYINKEKQSEEVSNRIIEDFIDSIKIGKYKKGVNNDFDFS